MFNTHFSHSVTDWVWILVRAFVLQAVGALRRGDLLQTFPLWQLRLVVDFWNSRMLRGPSNRHDTLLTSEFLPVMKNAVDVALDSWLKGEKGFDKGCVRALMDARMNG